MSFSCHTQQLSLVELRRVGLLLRTLGLLVPLLWLAACRSNKPTTQPDQVPPGRVDDLSIDRLTSSSAILTWTATGDDGAIGAASFYEIKLSTQPITDANWAFATNAGILASAHIAGTRESYAINNLQSATVYQFAIRAVDNSENHSAVSNTVAGTTLAEPSHELDPVLAPFIISSGFRTLTIGWEPAPSHDSHIHYEVVIGTQQITEDNFAPIVNVDRGASLPITATFESLIPGTVYFVGIRAANEAGAQSDVRTISQETQAEDGYWERALPPLTGGLVTGLVQYKGEIVAIGGFSAYLGRSIRHFAKFKHGAWEEFSPYPGDIAISSFMRTSSERLYLFGSGAEGVGVEVWDGSAWHRFNALTSGADPLDRLLGAYCKFTQAIVISDSNIWALVGGNARVLIPREDGSWSGDYLVEPGDLLHWNGVEWTKPIPSARLSTLVLSSDGSELFSSGLIPRTNLEYHVYRISMDGVPTPIGGGFSNPGELMAIRAVQPWRSSVVVAGSFEYLNGLERISSPAIWDGSEWRSLGARVSSYQPIDSDRQDFATIGELLFLGDGLNGPLRYSDPFWEDSRVRDESSPRDARFLSVNGVTYLSVLTHEMGGALYTWKAL